MARDALANAERQEIKDLANAIITAQEAEIAQMRQWPQEWYGAECTVRASWKLVPARWRRAGAAS